MEAARGAINGRHPTTVNKRSAIRCPLDKLEKKDAKKMKRNAHYLKPQKIY